MEKIICALCNTAVEVRVLSSHLLTNYGWKMAPHLAKPVAEAPLIACQTCKCPECNVSLNRPREAWTIKDSAYMMLCLTARQHAGESRPCMVRLAGCV